MEHEVTSLRLGACETVGAPGPILPRRGRRSCFAIALSALAGSGCDESNPVRAAGSTASPASPSAPTTGAPAPSQPSNPTRPSAAQPQVQQLVLADSSGRQVRIRLALPDGWTVPQGFKDGDGSVRIDLSTMADPLTIESALSIGFACRGTCDSLRKNVITEPHRSFELHRKRGLEIEWLQQPKEAPPATFTSSFRLFNSLNRREQCFLDVDRLLSAPPLLNCHLRLNGQRSARLQERFEKAARICRQLQFEILPAADKP